ncbi:MAG: RagB/SusD family nutrient uptake outer membrane protein [Chitinophagaceae bacterium]|nr:RagB/SusD family nutrient uptake outer membrane protein [Chitinophagaceae bacterium]MCW5914443.1 RagB/SusD family nutrient uptake outer membrane protein [Chitinophagaceae bacterium]MCZ2395454.1 RagB/SusD family nutrient uptake outer membrane protein [Chitinophagales bacterium]
MQTKIFKGILLLGIITLSSCDKWLDIQPKGKILLTTAKDYGLLLDNLTSYNYADIAYLDDEAWRNASNISAVWNSWNMVAANMLYLPNSDYDRSLNATGNSGTSGNTFYQETYQKIAKTANNIIYAKGDMKGTQSEINTVVAEAKMLRAYSYFLLINLYAKPYDKATATTDGGVPLKLDPYIETEPNPAKSTVADIYAQIEKDINEAIPDLNNTAQTPYRFNKAAAYALKAKVHLFKKEFDECLDAALKSNGLNNQLYDLVTLVNPVTNKPTTPIYANSAENLYYANALGGTYIGQELIDLFKDALQQYGEGTDVTDARLGLYKRPASSVKDYMYILNWTPTTKEFAPNTAGLTTSEVILMIAECYARKGQNNKVTEVLKPYLESRYKNFVLADFTLPNDITGTVNFVIGERRKELARGWNRFLDLKRLNTEPAYQKVPTRVFPADPAGTPGIPQQTYTLPVNSPLYILPFPSKVLENDKRLTSNTW